MILQDAQTRLSGILAEVSQAFWTGDERTAFLNDAQRRIALITKGVNFPVEGVFDTENGTVPLSRTPLADAGGVEIDGRAVGLVPMSAANLVLPGWRRLFGTPRWVLVDTTRNRLHAVPFPLAGGTLSGTLACLPRPLAANTDPLYEGQPRMDRYDTATLYLAAAYALLKERNLEDFGAFYSLFQQEMQDAGVHPDDVPGPEALT